MQHKGYKIKDLRSDDFNLKMRIEELERQRRASNKTITNLLLRVDELEKAEHVHLLQGLATDATGPSITLDCENKHPQPDPFRQAYFGSEVE